MIESATVYGNGRIQNYTSIPIINILIKYQFDNFHTKLKNSNGAHHHNLESKTRNRRLWPRLSQDILLTDIEELSLEHEDQL